jgi:hypothetical protein
MVVKINSNSSPEEIKKAIEKLYNTSRKTSSKHLDASKYNGVIKLKEDPMLIQKRMRDE